MFIYGVFIFLGLLTLLFFGVSSDNTLFFLHILVTGLSVIFALFCYFVYEKNTKIQKLAQKIIPKINTFIDRYGIYLLLGLFFLFINYLTFSKHFHYASSGFDLGIFDQAVYKYSNFQFPASSSIREIANLEADHFHPILFVYGLLYKIWGYPLLLLLLQNFFFVLGGLGIYRIAKMKLNIPIIGFVVVFLYLIFRGNINALLFDFHPLVIAVSLFPWLLYFSLQKKWLAYFLLLIPILLSKENLSIYIIFFGIFQFFIQKQRIVGIISFVIGVVYFYAVMNYFLPMMGGGGKYWSYDAVGANPKEFLINSLTDPFGVIAVLFSSIEKGITYLHHLGSGLYLALFSPMILFLFTAYAQKFLSSREEFWTLNFHYSIDVYWCIALGMIFTFAWMIKKFPERKHQLLLFFSIFIFTNSFLINMYKSPLLYPSFHLENKQELDIIIQSFPADAKISTQNEIIPHLSHREHIYLFPNLGNADYILINVKLPGLWPIESPEHFSKYIQTLKQGESLQGVRLPFMKEVQNFTAKYKLTKEQNGILLFEKIGK